MKKKIVAIIFIVASIIFIGTLCGIYGYRLIHFYKLEHPKVENGKPVDVILVDTLTDASKLVVSGDGLYKEDKGYSWKGNKVNNYISYSGITWRAIRVNKDDSITLISNDVLTSMVSGYKVEEFKASYAYSWLNDTFYPLLNNNDIIVDTTYCVDKIEDETSITCKVKETSKVALLSISEYLEIGGSKSYLKNGKNFWTSNASSDYKTWFINEEGIVTDSSITGESYHSYGIRPVITIKGDVKIYGGNGTESEPYQITNVTSTVLKDKTIGSYISYSDQIWKIIGKDENGVKVALDGTLKNGENDLLKAFSSSSNIYSTSVSNNIGYYLNSTYYKTLKNPEYLVDYNWIVRYYNSEQKYNYLDTTASTVKAKVGMLQVGDLYLNDVTGYLLLTSTSKDEGTIFKVNEDGRLYGDLVTTSLKVRPAVVLKNELKVVSGSGTLKDPFVLGE